MGIGYDLMARRKDGSVFPVEIGLSSVHVGDDVFVIALISDISRRKELEEALRNSEERWQFALEGSDQGIWDWNLETDKVFYSRQWKAMLGYKEEEISENRDDCDKRIHPDDREGYREAVESHLRGETSVFQNEHRILCKDGTYKWVFDRGKVMSRDSADKPLRMVGTLTDISDRKHAEELLEKAARTDFLTGLSNRRDFIERLEVEASRFARTGRPFSIVLCDIDYFKNINDTYGHNCADYVLKNIADMMRRSLRKQDAIGRWGGEEFIILLPETGLSNAGQSAEKIREKIAAARYSYHGTDFHVSMSFGVSVIDRNMTIDEAIKMADDRLYVAKMSGKNRVVSD